MKGRDYFYAMGQRYATIYPIMTLNQCIVLAGLNPNKDNEYPCKVFVSAWLDVVFNK